MLPSFQPASGDLCLLHSPAVLRSVTMKRIKAVYREAATSAKKKQAIPRLGIPRLPPGVESAYPRVKMRE
jgi:hypothetical protein